MASSLVFRGITREEAEKRPKQAKVDALTEKIGKLDTDIKKFTDYNTITGKKIMAQTGIDATQLARLPSRASRADRSNSSDDK